MIRIQHLPELRDPVVLCAFNGWSDGSFATSGAMAYLIAKWETQRFAELDPDQIYVYTTTRPNSVLVEGGERSLRWPELAFHALRLPHAPRDLVLLVGPEPDLLWRACSETLAQFVRRLGASLLITLGCFLATVPHRGQVPLVGLSTNPELKRKLELLGAGSTDYQGPTAFTTALVDASWRSELPACSIWSAAPAYLQGGTNPKVAAALLRAVEGILGLQLGVDELEGAGRDLEKRVEEALAARPDLQRFVNNLSGGASMEPPETVPEAPAERPELPTPKEFLAEMESFLRGLQQKGPDQPDPRGP